jgi:fructose-1,6-bisphosphatase I
MIDKPYLSMVLIVDGSDMTPTSLDQHLQRAHINDNLSTLILKIAAVAVDVHKKIPQYLRKTGTRNIFGEEQVELETLANDLYLQELGQTGLVKNIASEEEKEIIDVGEGEFTVAIDPLDGTSNLDSNNSCGMIAGIYPASDFPSAGKNQLAALYVLYGPTITLVFTALKGVHEFLYTGKGFFLSKENLKLLSPGSLYGIGGMRWKWKPSILRWVEEMEKGKLKLRYGGALVADFNQVLTYGGIFGYPALIDAPEGKIRLFFEANPIALITSEAGGKASTGRGLILEVESNDIFKRTPVFFGSTHLVEKLEEAIQKNP